MAGAIIENMSTKKLVIVGVILLLFQAFAFMVGGLIGKLFFPRFPCLNFICTFITCFFKLTSVFVRACTRVFKG